MTERSLGVPENPKLLFINPPSLRLVSLRDPFTYPFPYVPYGPLHVATYMETHGFEVGVFNADFNVKRRLDKNEDSIWEEVRGVLRRFKPDVLGISMRTLQYKSAIRTAQIAREMNEDVVVVVGGWHPSFMPEETIQERSFDFVVRGEGEKTFLELIRALVEGRTLNQVEGIAYREDGKVVVTSERPLIRNLDVLPFPDRELLVHRRYYPYLEISTITTSRGCPHRCTFCPSNAFWGYRTRSAKNIVDEIEYLMGRYGMEEFWFLSESFFISRKNILLFYEELKRRRLDIIWGGMARVDELDRELVRKLKSVGLYNISLGAETGSQELLDVTKKGITIEQTRKAVKLLREEGVFVNTYWMIGYQEETMETLEVTKNLIKTLNSDDIDVVFMIPFPGTEEFEKAESSGRLVSADWSEYHLRNPYLLDRPFIDTETLYDAYKKVFVKLQVEKAHRWIEYLVKHPKILSKKLRSIIRYHLVS